MAKPQLPDPPFFTLPQIAERWGCDVDYIERFTHSGQLTTVPYEAACHGCREIKAWLEGVDTPPDESKKRHGVLYLKIPNLRNWTEVDREFCFREFYRHLELTEKLEPVVMLDDLLTYEAEHGLQRPQQAAMLGGKWPWGDYETPLLQILAEAVKQFCLNDPDNFPDKKTGVVVKWVKERMVQAGLSPSDVLADKVETIISPRPYSHHRQRKSR